MNKKMLVLNGSPRKNGTSYSFALTVKKLAESENCLTDIIHIIEYFDGKKSLEDLREAILKSDIIGLIMPLYYDTLPYPVIWFFDELISKYSAELHEKNFFAVSQNGFPDPTLFEPILGSCKCFAEAAGMKWLGGIGYCGGAIINGTLMEDLGKKGEKITEGFKLMLNDILKEKEITPESKAALSVNIPKLLYRPLAIFLNHRSRAIGKKNGVLDLKRKVYLED